MAKWDDVTLLCEPDPSILHSKPIKRHRPFLKYALSVVAAIMLVVVVAIPILSLRHLPNIEHSRKGSVVISHTGNGEKLPDLEARRNAHPKEIVSQVLSERQKAFEEVLKQVEQFKDEMEEYVDAYADTDEHASLLETVGEDPADPDAVAFLLPLRGRDGALGIRYGRRMKQVLEKYIQDEKENGTNDSTISSVLVRDSQGVPEVARKLTSHFYEIHGTTRYFGYLTDDEALEVAHWARSKAPGTRFVTPTATTTYLESAKNVVRVQPLAKVLAVAVANLLNTLGTPKPLAVVRASLHTDSFLALLRRAGIKPSQVFHYYENTNITRLLEHLDEKLSITDLPVLLLGDIESSSLVEQADRLFPATWILPFPTQIGDNSTTIQSELLAFMYRAFDDKPGSFMKEETMLDPVESIVAASKTLLTGKRRSWQGAFVVAGSVPSNALKANVSILGTTGGWIPLLQYDISKGMVTKRIYQQLVVTSEIVKPLRSGSDCRLILTYLEELTGKKKVEQIQLDRPQPLVIVPAERGAQLHVDCPQQHADLRCTAPKGEWEPVKCKGALQGQHEFMRSCGRDISMTIPTSKGCLVNRCLPCRHPSSLGCLMADICSSVTHAKPFSECAGMHVEGK